MENQLVIPEKLKIGFNERDDTYSGKLAFLTYYLKDGTTKHKKTWENWIEKEIPITEIENKPKEGFILNRNEGGGGRWSYNEREAKIRVWDPVGFEFEITIPNMLDILQTCGSYPGKGLEGKFVYAFDGNRLNLLPVKSEAYRNSVEFTNLVGLSITKDDLIIGATYISKKQETLIYMGYFPWIINSYFSASKIEVKGGHIFYEGNKKNPGYYVPKREPNMSDKEWEDELADVGPEYSESFEMFKITDIAKCLDKSLIPNFAELVDKLQANGRIFTKEKLLIKKKNMVCKAYKEEHWSTTGIYEDDILWIKKNENTYESVGLLLMFDPSVATSSRYGRGSDSKANGIRIMYGKKITISGDEILVTKSSKVDNKIYLPNDIEVMEFYKIQLDMTEFVTKEIMSCNYYSKKEKKSTISKYAFKEIA